MQRLAHNITTLHFVQQYLYSISNTLYFINYEMILLFQVYCGLNHPLVCGNIILKYLQLAKAIQWNCKNEIYTFYAQFELNRLSSCVSILYILQGQH